MSALRKRKSRANADGAVTFQLSNHPFYLFSQIFLARGREINRDLAPYNLDYQRWRVLVVLNEFPDCTMQFLAETAGVDRTTLTHTVRLMIEERLATKTERKTDRRSVVLSLTEKGRKTLRAILPTMIAINERCFAGFSDAELSHFTDQLRRIFRNLKNGNLPPLVEPASPEMGQQLPHASVAVRRRMA